MKPLLVDEDYLFEREDTIMNKADINNEVAKTTCSKAEAG